MPLRNTSKGAVRDLTLGTDLFLPDSAMGQISIPVDLTQFTNKEIDADGYLKPGIPLDRLGAMIGNSPAFVYGVTTEHRKVAEDNETATISALGTEDIAVFLICCVVRHVGEDILDRAYTANEIAGFDRAGSKSHLIYTS